MIDVYSRAQMSRVPLEVRSLTGADSEKAIVHRPQRAPNGAHACSPAVQESHIQGSTGPECGFAGQRHGRVEQFRPAHHDVGVELHLHRLAGALCVLDDTRLAVA